LKKTLPQSFLGLGDPQAKTAYKIEFFIILAYMGGFCKKWGFLGFWGFWVFYQFLTIFYQFFINFSIISINTHFYRFLSKKHVFLTFFDVFLLKKHVFLMFFCIFSCFLCFFMFFEKHKFFKKLIKSLFF